MMNSLCISLAVLKKYFEQSPYSKSVEMDSQTELRCIPPDGMPMPGISWLRDGRVIERGGGDSPNSNSNYIITADGHFLIAQTRLSDMGNYSCVAENIASRRVSEPALLTVYGKIRPPLSSFMYPLSPEEARGKRIRRKRERGLKQTLQVEWGNI